MMRHDTVKKSVIAVCAAMMLMGSVPVSAAELPEAGVEAVTPETVPAEAVLRRCRQRQRWRC